jgi:Predicted membrane protein (DUF2207) N-terminal domain
LAIVPALPAAADTSGERITSYDVVLAVLTDGSMRAQETIGYEFGGNERHGIVRDIVTERATTTVPVDPARRAAATAGQARTAGVVAAVGERMITSQPG